MIIKMDRQSPTSIRYSLTNSSSNTDSMNISRSLQRSGNFISSQILSARNGYNNHQLINNVSDVPIIQHPSQSAHSSSIPSHYMDEPQVIQSQRTTLVTHQSQQHSQQVSYAGSLRVQNSLQIGSSQNGQNNALNNSSMHSSFNRNDYEMQIAQLTFMIKRQTEQLQEKEMMVKEHKELKNKYQRSLVQLNQFYVENGRLKEEIQKTKQSRVLLQSKNEDTSIYQGEGKQKQQQIRRLRDSILVLQKERDAYQKQHNHATWELQSMKEQNETYENKLALISGEVERLNLVNKEKSSENDKLKKANSELQDEIEQLKKELQNMKSSKIAQDSLKNSQYVSSLDQLHRQIFKLKKIKSQLENENQRIFNQSKSKIREYEIQIQKYKVQENTQKRQFEELQNRNRKLQFELKNLFEKNNSSQLQLSQVETQTSTLQRTIRELQEKLKLMQQQYHNEVERIRNTSNTQNTQLRGNMARMEEEIKLYRSQVQKSEQESTQLRRKIQQITFSSEKQFTNIGESLKQRDYALRELETQNSKANKKILELQQRKEEYQRRLKQAEAGYESKYREFKQRYDEFEKVRIRLEQKHRQIQRECKQTLESNTRLEERNKILQREYNQNYNSLGQRYKILQKQYKESRNAQTKLQQKFKAGEVQYRQLEHKCNEFEMQCKQLEVTNKQLIQNLKLNQQQIKSNQQQYQILQQNKRQLEFQLIQTRQHAKQLHQQNVYLQESIQQTSQNNSVVENKSRLIQQQAYQYKQSLQTLTSKYRTLQLEYSHSKQSVTLLQNRYTEIESRSNALQQQLNNLQAKYTQLCAIHAQLEQQLAALRELVQKTQQERYHLEQAKQEDVQYFKQQISNKEIVIKNITIELENKIKQISQKNAYIMGKEEQYRKNVQKYQENINKLNGQVENLHRNINNMSGVSIQNKQLSNQLQLTRQQLAKVSKQYQLYIKRSEQSILNLQGIIQQKDYNIKQMQFNVNNYMDKINILTTEINNMSDQFNASRYIQSKEMQNIIHAKNIKIQDLERELIHREQYYREEIRRIQHDHEIRTNEEITKIKTQTTLKNQQLEYTARTLTQQLRRQQSKYQELVQKLQRILNTNQNHFEQILEYLQKILQINTELIMVVSKNTAHIEGLNNNEREESLGLLVQIKDKVWKESEENKARYEEDENRRINKQRMDRKQKQDMLEREERIIKYLQEEKERTRVERDRQEKKLREIEHKIEEYNHNNIQMIQKLAYNITQNIKQHREFRDNENANPNSKHMHDNIGNILSKMQNLTALFVQYNEEYKQNKNATQILEQSNKKLEQTNERYKIEIQELRKNEQELESRYRMQLESICRSQQMQFQSQVNQYKSIRYEEDERNRKQIEALQNRFERSKIESQEMRKQYDNLLVQYQKANASITQQLEFVKKQFDRLDQKCKQKQQQLEKIKLNSSFASSNRSQENAQMRLKYESQANQFKREIERLHGILDASREKISSLQNQIRHIEQKNRHEESLTIAASQNKFNQLQRDINELNATLRNKSIEVESLKTKLQVSMSENLNAQSYQYEITQLKRKLSLSQKENVNLHAEIDKSLKTIHNLTQKVQTFRRSYKEMTDHAESIQNKIRQLSSKYNNQLMNKSAYEQKSERIHQSVIKKMEAENKALKDRVNEVENNYENIKQEFNKMQNIIESLKQDNLGLKNKNYNLEVQLQKTIFMKQKIGKLNIEVDRISQLNIQLNQEVDQCRFALGEEATMERRLVESYLMIVIMGAEIEALRARIEERNRADSTLSRELSRQKRKSPHGKERSVSKDKNPNNHNTKIKIF